MSVRSGRPAGREPLGRLQPAQYWSSAESVNGARIASGGRIVEAGVGNVLSLVPMIRRHARVPSGGRALEGELRWLINCAIMIKPGQYDSDTERARLPSMTTRPSRSRLPTRLGLGQVSVLVLVESSRDDNGQRFDGSDRIGSARLQVETCAADGG